MSHFAFTAITRVDTVPTSTPVTKTTTTPFYCFGSNRFAPCQFKFVRYNQPVQPVQPVQKIVKQTITMPGYRFGGK